MHFVQFFQIYPVLMPFSPTLLMVLLGNRRIFVVDAGCKCCSRTVFSDRQCVVDKREKNKIVFSSNLSIISIVIVKTAFKINYFRNGIFTIFYSKKPSNSYAISSTQKIAEEEILPAFGRQNRFRLYFCVHVNILFVLQNNYTAQI